jgi:trehalose/maltose hydrolase-like predicted phosphorylase
MTYAGLDVSGDVPALKPVLPELWTSLAFGFQFRGIRYQVVISGKKVTISCHGGGKKEIKVDICGTLTILTEDKPETINVT